MTMIDLAYTYSKELVAFGLALLASLIQWSLRAKPRLWWSVHSPRAFLHSYKIPRENQPPLDKNDIYNSSSFSLNNSGRATAQDVEIVFNWRPQLLNLWPQRLYTEHENPEGRFIIKIGTLGPKEFIGIDMLSCNRDLPAIVQVRAAVGSTKNIAMYPQRIFPKWMNMLLMYFTFLGFATSIYFAFVVLQFAIGARSGG
jgi:hypothetical protein